MLRLYLFFFFSLRRRFVLQTSEIFGKCDIMIYTNMGIFHVFFLWFQRIFLSLLIDQSVVYF